MKNRIARDWSTGVVLCLAAVVLAITAESASLKRASAALITKGPYLQMPGSRTMTIMWESRTNHAGAVLYGLKGNMTERLGPISPRILKGVTPVRRTNVVSLYTNGLTVLKTNVVKRGFTNSFYVYQATLTNLAPGAIYAYAVEMDGQITSPRTFKTFSEQPDSVRFVAYGDSRSNPKVHRTIARRFGEFLPEFVLHSGDLVMAGKDYGLWSKEFFDPVAGVADQTPILSVPGNHEEDLKNYLAYFPMRGTNCWYSFDAGPVHVLALDYRQEKASSEQFKFARQDLLESKAPWKIVSVHYPVFNYGHHNSGWGHKSYLPLFREARVDLVLSGHSHMYERFRPIAPVNEPGAWPITALTTAGGGAELHRPYPHPAHAKALSTFHFTLLEATRETLKARAIDVDGTEIDSFEICKPAGHYDARYANQVYPEEMVRLSYEVGESLLGKLTRLPTNQQPVQAMLDLRAIKASQQPVDLEITLTPDSAKHYAVEGLPLRVTTPGLNESNRLVWLSIKAIGKKKIKGPELDPPLVFQARVSSGRGETLAYGPFSRTSRTASRLWREASPSVRADARADLGVSVRE